MSPLVAVTPFQAAGAYAQADRGAAGLADPLAGPSGDAASGFGAALARAAQGVVETGRAADAQAAGAIAGTANLTEVAAAVSRADLALQATSAIRDRMVAAYQDIMKTPI